METRTKNKTATVCKDQTGYWAAFAHDTGERLGGLHSTELDAYRAANSRGYLIA